MQEVQRELSSAGLDCSGFTGHSFRIAAASTAKARDVDDSTIKELGWWKSKAFEAYIKMPASRHARRSKQSASLCVSLPLYIYKTSNVGNTSSLA